MSFCTCCLQPTKVLCLVPERVESSVKQNEQFSHRYNERRSLWSPDGNGKKMFHPDLDSPLSCHSYASFPGIRCRSCKFRFRFLWNHCYNRSQKNLLCWCMLHYLGRSLHSSIHQYLKVGKTVQKKKLHGKSEVGKKEHYSQITTYKQWDVFMIRFIVGEFPSLVSLRGEQTVT